MVRELNDCFRFLDDEKAALPHEKLLTKQLFGLGVAGAVYSALGTEGLA